MNLIKLNTFLFQVYILSISQFAFGDGEKSVKEIIPERILKFIDYGYLPDVSDQELKAIFQSKETFWYDKFSLPHVYQDSIDRIKGVHHVSVGLDASASENGALVFDKKGFLFPFATAFGIDRAPDVHLLNFLALPKVDGVRANVVYWKEGARWRWIFPNGTIIGEILLIPAPKEAKQSFYAVEVRTRRRYAEGWEPNVYRPFESSKELANAIMAKRPNWKSSEQLRKAVDHLTSSDNLVEKTLSATPALSSAFPAVTGHLDVIPDFGDSALVADLLKSTPFKSVEGKIWKSHDKKLTFGPSTDAAFSITPQHFEGGLFPVNEVSCNRCHEKAGSPIGNYSDRTQSYGEIWGEDNIFTWHLFDPNENLLNLSVFGNFENNWRLNEGISAAGLIEPFDPAKHSEKLYRQLPKKF